ncbi:BolA family protein [Sphingomonas sp.]|uniref:BolA family protein n=1 Tax=Sphingomonas sp. TaxID=28214 RepID=UPI002DD648F5|nr:BolA family protein [Sphingomonas sp.]
MTDAATAPLAPEPLESVIAARLTDALAPSHLIVTNDSHHHAGHMGDDGTGETHFSVDIESEAFAGQNRVARQRLVNRALADLLETRIHALAIKARAPGGAA